MTDILTAAQQKTVELAAVQRGVSLAELMESAGYGVYAHITGRTPVLGRSAVLLCGRGGNGGDGFVAARHLMEAGANPVIVLCAGTPETEPAAEMYKKAVMAGVPVLDAATEFELCCTRVQEAAILVDAVFGIGFHGELPDTMRRLFAAANENVSAYKLAVDLPSGLDADSGAAAADSFIAADTLTVIARKPAHVLKSAAKWMGQVTLADIGVPEAAYSAVPATHFTLTLPKLRGALPPRDACAHKGSYGSLLCVAGCDRFRGAASLCTKAALYGPAGLVYLASTAKALDAAAVHCPEAILLDSETDEAGFADGLRRAAAVVMGCGMGTDERARTLFERVTQQTDCPLVLDADGINLLSGNIDSLKGMAAKRAVVLTPHVGEFARLVGCSAEDVLRGRIRMARDFAKAHGVVLVLKSENTVVALPNGRVFINVLGNAGLAKGGSGDLLAGLIGSLLAAGAKAGEAAAMGVWTHSRAADLLAAGTEPHAMTAMAVAQRIPEALGELVRG